MWNWLAWLQLLPLLLHEEFLRQRQHHLVHTVKKMVGLGNQHFVGQGEVELESKILLEGRIEAGERIGVEEQIGVVQRIGVEGQKQELDR